jgi:cytochrome c
VAPAVGLTRVNALRTTGTYDVRVKMAWSIIVLGALAVSQGAPGAEPPSSLTRFRCYVCHSDRETLAGPAFADVAAAYRGRQDAVTRIARDIRAGTRGGGPWHMPPHPEVSPAEARAMARYIMSLAPKDGRTQYAQPH